jgi:hypothetical protein
MAYSCSGSQRAAYLSSPSITINGQAGGSATQGHCARRITETAASRAAVFAERFSGTVGALTSQVNSAKCLDAWKYVQGTQVRPPVPVLSTNGFNWAVCVHVGVLRTRTCAATRSA